MKSKYLYEMEILDNMLDIVSNKNGLINSVVTSKHVIDNKNIIQGQVPSLYLSNIIMNNSKEKESGFGGSGVSLSKNMSIIKAIGEFIERFYAIEGNEADLYTNSLELGKQNIKYIDIRDLIFFSDEQYKNNKFLFTQYNPSHNIYWTNAYDVITNELILVPSQKVYLGMNYVKAEKEVNYDFRLSTGLACGDSLENAILSGLYECIERDAFYLSWMAKIPGRKIIIDEVKNYDLKKLLKFINRYSNGNLHIIDISIDTSAYTVLTIIENCNGIGFTVAAATNLDPEIAILKSLEEQYLTHSFILKLYHNRYNSKYPEISDLEIKDLNDHSIYYMNPEKRKAIDFYKNNQIMINLSELLNKSSYNKKNDLLLLSQELKSIGSNVVYKDIFNEELNHIGFKVVKVLATNLANLDITCDTKNLGNKRLNNILRSKGIEMNKDPHPFP